jgi:hypothetical protein
MEQPNRRNETDAERWDRNFADLLQELRVAQTGVQILFAFLLTIPFANRFAQTDYFQRDVYVVALLAATAATGLIIAPVAYHRMLFQRGQKPALVVSAHRMAIAGLVAVAVAMVCSVLLVTDFVLDRPVAIVISGASAGSFLLLWFLLPLSRRNDRWTRGGELPSSSTER